MTGTMFEFLGLNGFDTDRVTQILGQKLNAQQVGDFPHPLIGPLTSHRAGLRWVRLHLNMDTKRRMYAAAKVAIKRGAMGDIRGKKILVIGGAGFMDPVVTSSRNRTLPKSSCTTTFVAEHTRTWNRLLKTRGFESSISGRYCRWTCWRLL